MREIKFREWDQNRHEIYGGDIPGMSYGNREDFDDMVGFRFAHTESIDYEGTEEFKNKRILEQYTGLHDKNGKEIYEGDLIKFKYKILFKIEWFNTAFWAIPQAGRGSSQPLSNLYSISDKNADYIEVIGNIHENPELLEEEQ